MATTAVVTADPCEMLDAMKLGSSPTSGDSYYMRLPSLRACMQNAKISHANAIWTLHNLHFGIAETYSFTDISVDSAASTQTNACNYKLHAVKVDLVGAIKSQIALYNARLTPMTTEQVDAYLNEERPAYEFHAGLVRLMNKLHDAHTSYATPFDMFRVYFPLNFGSRMEGGRQVIYLRYSTDTATPIGRLAYVHRRIFGAVPLDARYNGQVVTQVNGIDALEFLKQLVGEEGPLAATYQQMEQRLNAFVFSTPLLVLSQVVATLPDYDSIRLRFADGSEFTVNLLGQFADRSTSPYYSVPNLRSTEALSSFMHTNEAFSAFLKLDEEAESKKPTLWKYASAAASGPGNMGPRLMSRAGAQNWGLISKKHKAMLDPVKNMAKDNILNVPMVVDEDALILGDEEPVRAEHDPAVFARMIEAAVAASNPVSAGSVAFTQVGGMSYGFTGDTVVVRIPSMVPEERFGGDDQFYFFPDFVRIQQDAKSRGITRLVVDVTNNGGGYVISAYALLWYLMADTTRICAPLRKRITDNWEVWIESFGDGLNAIVDKHMASKGASLAGQIDPIFKEIVNLVTLVYDGFGYTYDVIGPVSKQVALSRVAAEKAAIIALSTDAAKAARIVSYIKQKKFLPDEAPFKQNLMPYAGFCPFDPYEITQLDTRARPFSPLLDNYKKPQTKRWGRPAKYSQPGEYSFCFNVMQDMPSVARGYESGYWTQVSFVSDGTCGSACALFTQGIQTNGDAVAFTYGGVAGTAMDVASFAGGNVEEYDSFWPNLAFAAKLGHLASLGAAPWSEAHEHTWVAHPIAFPTKASARFNWNMMFVEAMGDDALPRQFYLIPGRKHFDFWASTDVELADLYAQIAAIPNWADVPPQFASTHGQCPREATPFAERQTRRVF